MSSEQNFQQRALHTYCFLKAQLHIQIRFKISATKSCLLSVSRTSCTVSACTERMHRHIFSNKYSTDKAAWGCAYNWTQYDTADVLIIWFLWQVRCLVDVPGDKLPSQLSEYLREIIVPQIPEGLQIAMREAIDAGRIRSMLNKTMPAAPLHQPGALLLGDAFNMRHPLTGTWVSKVLFGQSDVETSADQSALFWRLV